MLLPYVLGLLPMAVTRCCVPLDHDRSLMALPLGPNSSSTVPIQVSPRLRDDLR